jgi:hypothetical protein
VEDDGSTEFHRQQWLAESEFRRREIDVKEREQALKEKDFEFQRAQAARTRWTNPLFIGLVAAAIAAFGNAVVAYLNAREGQVLEETRAESGRILEMIKTGNPDQAAENLRFLLDTGLVATPKYVADISTFLQKRKPNQGPTLPAPAAPRLTRDEVGHIVSETFPKDTFTRDEVEKEAQSLRAAGALSTKILDAGDSWRLLCRWSS